MKNILKLLSLLLVILVAFVSCEEEEEWYSDYSGSGDAYVQFSDAAFDYGLFLDAEGNVVTPESFPIYVKIQGPAQSSDVTVGISVTQSTGGSGEWSLSSTTATIPAGKLTGSVMITIDKDEAVLDSTYEISLELNSNSSLPVYGNATASATVTVMKGLSCALDYSYFTGDFYYKTIWEYDVNPVATVTPDADKDVLAIDMIWDEIPGVNITLDVGGEIATNTYELSSDNQAGVWNGDLTSWGLSDNCSFDFDDFNAGMAMSCTGEFQFACTPYIVDNADGSVYWWGGEFVFEFVPGTPPPGAKSVSIRPNGDFKPELQRIK